MCIVHVERIVMFLRHLLHQMATLTLLLATAVTLQLTNVQVLQADQPNPPNVVFILADDLGYAELGCYGQKWIKTPNLDKLAGNGMRFTQHYSAFPVCAPARCSLMTGKHAGHCYIRDNGNPPGRKSNPNQMLFPGQNPIPPEEVTIAELFKQRGYATAAMGKWGLGYEGSTGDPNRQGFDLFFGFLCQVHAHNHYPRFLWRNDQKVLFPGNDRTLNGQSYSQDLFIEEAVKFVRQNQDKPFFLYLPFAVPHLSIQVPNESVEPYKETIAEAEYKHRGYLKHPFPRAGYAGMVTHMDAGIGRVLDCLEELGLSENTIVVFTSDNGPTYNRLAGSDSEFFASAEGRRGLKGSVYEGGIRVPMIVRWPGKVPAGKVSDLPCYFPDWLPTLLDLTGNQQLVPEDVDGISLAPSLLGKVAQQQREFLYWEFPGYGGQQALRVGKWKAVRQNLRKGDLRTQIYDLEADPSEKHDIAADHPEVVARLEAIMQREHTPSKLFPMKSLD